MTGLKIRIAAEADFEAVRNFYWDIIDAVGDKKNYSQWKKGIYPADDDLMGFISRGELFISECDGGIVAALAMNHNCADGYEKVDWAVSAEPDETSVIHILGVSGAHWGKGIAKALLFEAFELARANGQKVIRLDTLVDNDPARRLYESAGFDCRGEISLYYEDTGVTDFYMYEYVL